jgi:hypothetical protein
MTPDRRKRILSGALSRFNELKAGISAASRETPGASPKRDPGSGIGHPGLSPREVSPLDELISVKPSVQSPVDDLVDQIHLLHVIDGPESGSSPAQDPAPPAHPDLREVVPDRRHVTPLEEIEARLDAFFDEDRILSDPAFADGDQVVPYEPLEQAGTEGEDASADTGGMTAEPVPQDKAVPERQSEDPVREGPPTGPEAALVRRIREALETGDDTAATEAAGALETPWANDPEGLWVLAMLESSLRLAGLGRQPIAEEARAGAAVLVRTLESRCQGEPFAAELPGALAQTARKLTILQDTVISELVREQARATQDMDDTDPGKSPGLLSRLKTMIGLDRK